VSLIEAVRDTADGVEARRDFIGINPLSQ